MAGSPRDRRWLAESFDGHDGFRLESVHDFGRDGASVETWDVALLHHRPPAPVALDWLRRLQTERPTLPVVVVSPRLDGQALLEALRAGAVGYLVRPIPADELRHAVRLAAHGQAPLSPAATLGLVRHLHRTRPAVLARHFKLSNRDLDVLALLQQGRSDKEIAEKLGLAFHTVREYVRRLYGKLDVHSRTQALRKLHEL